MNRQLPPKNAAAGMKPYKHTTLTYQSGCQKITPPHVLYTLSQSVCEKSGQKIVRNKRWRDVREGRDKRVAGMQNHSAFERACTLMSVSTRVPSGIPPQLFLPSCHSNHHLYACAPVSGECIKSTSRLAETAQSTPQSCATTASSELCGQS